MRRPPCQRPAATRKWLRILVALSAIGLLCLFSLWKTASDNGGQKPAEPFRIAGNLYYVGASDAAAFLLTGPQGHVLIDGGYPGTARLILDSITKLGFRITDVKLLLNSHGHFDHAGGLAALKNASGARLWANEREAESLESGGAKDISLGPLRYLAVTGLIKYPPVVVDRRLKDRATIRLGPIEVTAHLTAGHTRGCTTWAFPVRDKGRELLTVYVCEAGLALPPFVSLIEPQRYPGVRGDYERSFNRLRSLPADIYLAPHARHFGRWRKFQARRKGGDPAAPFIDPEGYREAINRAELKFRKVLAEQQNQQQ